MADLDISKIPAVMRANKWECGAKLMEKWFADPANSSPAAGIASTDIITMDWVLGFSRAKEVFDKLVSERIWLNEPGKKEIVTMLTRKGLLNAARQRFGLPRLALPTLDGDSIQYRVVGSTMDMIFGPMDDLRAALANFTFRVVVAGTVEPVLVEQKGPSGAPVKKPNGEYRVVIEEVGVYVKDSYDFNDAAGQDQELGNWNFEKNSVGRSGLLNGGIDVHNSDFRKWRTANKKGGDFMVYSDVRVLRQSVNNTFTFKR